MIFLILKILSSCHKKMYPRVFSRLRRAAGLPITYTQSYLHLHSRAKRGRRANL